MSSPGFITGGTFQERKLQGLDVTDDQETIAWAKTKFSVRNAIQALRGIEPSPIVSDWRRLEGEVLGGEEDGGLDVVFSGCLFIVSFY